MPLEQPQAVALALAMATMAIVRQDRLRQQKSRKRRKWVQQHLLEREDDAAYMNLIPGLK